MEHPAVAPAPVLVAASRLHAECRAWQTQLLAHPEGIAGVSKFQAICGLGDPATLAVPAPTVPISGRAEVIFIGLMACLAILSTAALVWLAKNLWRAVIVMTGLTVLATRRLRKNAA